ncbi:MAG: DUF4058 family protein [Gemmataceae bacterium]
MPSPFPGMNPYIEAETVWRDFHERLIPRMADAIGAQVLPRYFVVVDEALYVQDPPEGNRLFGYGDAAVLPGAASNGGAPAAATLTAPAHVWEPDVEQERLSVLNVVDSVSRDVVTVIELLSPTNKRRHRDQYLAKRARILASESHFVEIDLLRGGPRMPWRDMPRCDYYAVVSRVGDRPKADVWPAGLRDRLPRVPIPLRAADGDVSVELQDLLHAVYDAAGYAFRIYDAPPDPPLSAADAAWAAQFVPPRS